LDKTPDRKVKYTLRATGLDEVGLTGSGTVSPTHSRLTTDAQDHWFGQDQGGSARGSQLKVRVSAPHLSLAGRVGQQEISISGSGKWRPPILSRTNQIQIAVGTTK